MEQVVWTLPYASEFGSQAIDVEVALRPVIREPRRAPLLQLIDDRLVGDYSEAYAWTLDVAEARAEKVRAACTREAIRDFYDLDQLLLAGFDMNSPEFLELVDIKLAEMRAPQIATHTATFQLTDERRRELESSVRRELAAVLRLSEPPFDLGSMINKFSELWGKDPLN